MGGVSQPAIAKDRSLLSGVPVAVLTCATIWSRPIRCAARFATGATLVRQSITSLADALLELLGPVPDKSVKPTFDEAFREFAKINSPQ